MGRWGVWVPAVPALPIKVPAMPLQAAAGVLLIANQQADFPKFLFPPPVRDTWKAQGRTRWFTSSSATSKSHAALTIKWVEPRSRRPRPTWPVCNTESDGIPSMSCQLLPAAEQSDSADRLLEPTRRSSTSSGTSMNPPGISSLLRLSRAARTS